MGGRAGAGNLIGTNGTAGAVFGASALGLYRLAEATPALQ